MTHPLHPPPAARLREKHPPGPLSLTPWHPKSLSLTYPPPHLTHRTRTSEAKILAFRAKKSGRVKFLREFAQKMIRLGWSGASAGLRGARSRGAEGGTAPRRPSSGMLRKPRWSTAAAVDAGCRAKSCDFDNLSGQAN